MTKKHTFSNLSSDSARKKRSLSAIKRALKKVIIDAVAVKEILSTAYEAYQQERERRFGNKDKK